MIRATILAFFFTASLVLTESAYAQSLTMIDSTTHLAFLRSVKQFNEFIDRFNAESYEIPELSSKRGRKLKRSESILLLFHTTDPRLNRNSPLYSAAYEKEVLRFSEEAVERDYRIQKYSTQVKAIAITRIENKGRVDTIQIILQQEISEPNLLRWVISDVKGKNLQVPERDTITLRFLSPVSHELGFMDLRKALLEPKLAINYTRSDFNYDPLSTFIHGLYEGSIVFDEIIEVEWEVDFDNGQILKIGERQISAYTNGIVIYDLVDSQDKTRIE